MPVFVPIFRFLSESSSFQRSLVDQKREVMKPLKKLLSLMFNIEVLAVLLLLPRMALASESNTAQPER
jgi:hypothetical protein